MDITQISVQLRKRREFLDLRQEDLSEMSGVAIKSIQLVETGKGNPSLKTLNKMITVLGLELTVQIKNVI